MIVRGALLLLLFNERVQLLFVVKLQPDRDIDYTVRIQRPQISGLVNESRGIVGDGRCVRAKRRTQRYGEE